LKGDVERFDHYIRHLKKNHEKATIKILKELEDVSRISES
jgi:hypothetical protein